ncbi:MAG: transposase, partial [Thermoproteota archaeon]
QCRGGEHPSHPLVFGGDLRRVLLAPEHLSLNLGRGRGGPGWREQPLGEEYYAVFLDGTFLSIQRGKTAKEPGHMALGLKPDKCREILGCSRREGRVLKN